MTTTELQHHVEGLDVADIRERFRTDGVVRLPGVLHPDFVDLVATGIERNLRNPGPYRTSLYEGSEHEIVMDHSNFRTIPEYQILVADSPIVDLVADVLESVGLWLFFDQVWVKDPGAERRTPWHQDATYWMAGGSQVAGFWMSVDPLAEGESLEFVRGSHLGPVYAGQQMKTYGQVGAYYEGSDLPPIPDIEADRSSFDIVTWAHDPTDAILFHPATLHGGGAGTGQRRTLSLRFFGDDGVYSPRPGRPSPPCHGTAAVLSEGAPLQRSSWFPRLRPRPEPGWW